PCAHPHLPLFPYTPLFRSSTSVIALESGTGGRYSLHANSPVELAALPTEGPHETPVVDGLRRAGRGGRVVRLAAASEWRLEGALDRKSTRLNSSHVSISYA